MSSLKPLTLYSHPTGPNPWKVAIILEELNLPYDTKMVEMSNLKKPPFNTEITLNGRVPAIIDSNNNNLTLWESGAIVQYLIDTYDKDHKISYPPSSPENFLCYQWLHFQMSGQGPYYGQAYWFAKYHPEKVPSAVERYVKETERVIGVLDTHLQKGRTEFLVGNKCTYADLAFVPWALLVPVIAEDSPIDVEGKYPHYDQWLKRVCEREAVKKVLDDKARISEKK
ncbi:hypothetical protein GJ744_003117 [Endocarpon pusillum]|uniref:glutathione transferase n=1 Tax=Endocarpon pusillum TaxID=364733 RepID=A0A8H7E646_9EURO|nr:hypothetical protein GJ744_003117 [Endocarpon pusillum]